MRGAHLVALAGEVDGGGPADAGVRAGDDADGAGTPFMATRLGSSRVDLRTLAARFRGDGPRQRARAGRRRARRRSSDRLARTSSSTARGTSGQQRPKPAPKALRALRTAIDAARRALHDDRVVHADRRQHARRRRRSPPTARPKAASMASATPPWIGALRKALPAARTDVGRGRPQQSVATSGPTRPKTSRRRCVAAHGRRRRSSAGPRPGTSVAASIDTARRSSTSAGRSDEAAASRSGAVRRPWPA